MLRRNDWNDENKENCEELMSLNIASDHLDDNAESRIQNDNRFAGIIWMLLYVLWMTINHVMIKYLMVNHLYISSFDIIFALSIIVTLIYYFIGKYQGCNMNLFSFERNIVILIILRAAIGIVGNLLFLISLSQIIKTILIQLK